ncbi:MAG: transposase [Candidatus Aenigmarchaeota archaeon]|nr:transposase [Candidatus Aenigmarchaeota archaeon]
MNRSNVSWFKKDIYRTFSAIGRGQTIKTSEFLKTFELGSLYMKRKHEKFSTPSMMKLNVFMRLKGIKFQTRIVDYLKKNKEDAHNLGFGKEIPDQRTISHFLNHSLDNEANKYISAIVRIIETASEKFNVVLDERCIEVKRARKTDNKKTIHNRKFEKLCEACRYTKKNIYPHIRLEIGKNAKFSKKRYLDLLLETAHTNQFLENKSNTLRGKFKLGKINVEFPQADSLLYHLKKYGKGEEAISNIKSMYFDMFEKLWKTAKDTNKFKDRKLKVAIDYTHLPYYGNENRYMVTECKPTRGTFHSYTFASVCIVEHGMRFTLLALPVGKFDSKKKIVEELLEYTRKKISISEVLLDRGFFGIDVISLLRKNGIKYKMPAIKNAEIKRMCETIPAPNYMNDYRIGKGKKHTYTNIFFVKSRSKKDETMAFVTNTDISNSDIDFLEDMADDYGKRWGVETSYKDINEAFRARTVSVNYTIRFFYYMFSVIFYNVWILVKMLISLFLFGKIVEKSIISAKMFVEILVCVQMEVP